MLIYPLFQTVFRYPDGDTPISFLKSLEKYCESSRPMQPEISDIERLVCFKSIHAFFILSSIIRC